MSALRRCFVKKAHAYTSEDVPWIIDGEADGAALFRYLRGGGTQAFGTSAHAMKIARRQTRFLILSGCVGVAWALLWIL